MSGFLKHLIETGEYGDIFILEDIISKTDVLKVTASIAQLAIDLAPLIKAIDNKTIKSYLTGFKKSCIFISNLLSKVK